MPQARLDDYSQIVGREAIEAIRLLAQRASGKSLKMVNSTPVGGGVAEILNRLVPLLNEVGVETVWDVIKGDERFFSVTKAFHNALHGSQVEIVPEMFETFAEYNRMNMKDMSFDEDVVVIHDPQPAGLIEARKRSDAKWIWRCHIDLSTPDQAVWDYLEGFVKGYDASIFSSPKFARSLPMPQFLIPPSIDPLSDKNKELPQETIDSVLQKYKIPSDKPIITQVSRFDALKDPLGVISGYELAKNYVDCRLVLAGGSAADDPEGGKVLADVRERASSEEDIHILDLPPTSDIEINALQRASDIVIQKSVKEGFGLTVTEALWKKKPVIAGAVGGIPLQVQHNLTGLLVYSVEGLASQIRYLLENPTEGKKLGLCGHEYVRQKFLITRHLKDYLLLINAGGHLRDAVVDLK